MRPLWISLLTLLALFAGETAAREKPRLAVLELTMGEGTPRDARGYLSDVIRSSALQAIGRDHYILTRENLLEALPPGTELAECEGACEVETGRNIGAHYVVVGEIIPLGGDLRVALKLLRTRDGRLIAAEQSVAKDAADLPMILQKAAGALWPRLAPARPRPRARGKRWQPVYALGQWRVQITGAPEPMIHVWQPEVIAEIPVKADGWWRLRKGGKAQLIGRGKRAATVLDMQPQAEAAPLKVEAPVTRRWITAYGQVDLKITAERIDLKLSSGRTLRFRPDSPEIQVLLGERVHQRF